MVLMLVLACALALAGCGAQPAKDEAVASAHAAEPVASNAMEIREKMFIAQVNEIYINTGDYLGKAILYEGVFDQYPYNDAGDMFRSVIRYGPGCCGNDGNVGFEVVWDKAYPNQGDWVGVEGVLEEYQEDGQAYLRLRVSKLDVLPTRGNETVSQ